MSNAEMDKMIADYKTKNLAHLKSCGTTTPKLSQATRMRKRGINYKALGRLR